MHCTRISLKMSNLSNATEDNVKDCTSFAHLEWFFIYYFFSWATFFWMSYAQFSSSCETFCSVYAKLNSFSTKCGSVHAKSCSVHAKPPSVHAKSCWHGANSHYFVQDLAQFGLKFAHFVPYLARFCANEPANKFAYSKTCAFPSNSGVHLNLYFYQF